SDRHAIFVDSDSDESSNSSDHHDLQNPPHSRPDHENAKLMQIGIQTALAISIHKFPGIWIIIHGWVNSLIKSCPI
ncbi:7376_t:CDS:1, partial [Racocetra fulgida]